MQERGRTMRLGLLAPMPSELRPLVKALGLRPDPQGFHGAVGRSEVVAAGTGIGMRRAAEAAERLLDRDTFDHVMVVGIAGGLGPSRVGDVVVPEAVVDKASAREYRPAPLPGGARPSGRLVSHDDFDVTEAERAALVAGGFVAVDMETAAVAAVCESRSIEWSAVRSISDLVGVTPGDVITLATADGSPDLGASLRYLATKPWRVPYLVRLGLAARAAARAAAAEAARRVTATAG